MTTRKAYSPPQHACKLKVKKKNQEKEGMREHQQMPTTTSSSEGKLTMLSY